MSEPTAMWRTAYQHPGDWDRTFPPLSMPAMFFDSAARVPDAPLLDFMGRRYSYAAVASAVRRVACGLTRLGVRPGDRVGLFLPNVPHYVAAYYGALAMGAIVVNYSPLYSADELCHQVEDSGTTTLVTLSAKALLPTALTVMERCRIERLVVGSIAGGLPLTKSFLYRALKRDEVAATPDDPRVTRFSALIANDGAFTAPEVDPVRDVALLQYTGGTTGSPKGAMLTHQNLTANARQVAALDPHAGEGDRIMGVLPFFHVFANTCVLNRTVAVGGEIVMLPRFDAGQVLAAVSRTRPRSMPGVPTMYQALLDHPNLGRTDWSSLNLCISGAASISAELKARFETATGVTIAEGYGLTEASPVISTNPYFGDNRTGTVGQPLAGTTVVLVDRDDPTRPPPPGEPGEITVAGPQVMKGYWNRPDADAQVFVDGRLRTGDLGEMDADGYLRIVDRLKDMIAVGGFKVFPSRIETILYHHEAVREALVIGVPDHYRGECPKAFVTLHEGAAIEGVAIKAWANPQLGKHERLSAVEVRESLPKTLVGKLSRKELVAEERAKAAGRTSPA